jgi:hypothetical protein
MSDLITSQVDKVLAEMEEKCGPLTEEQIRSARWRAMVALTIQAAGDAVRAEINERDPPHLWRTEGGEG